MPRKKLTVLPGSKTPDCFAYYTDKGGTPRCRALSDVFCLKERVPCPFKATPEQAAAARKKAVRRLAFIGRL